MNKKVTKEQKIERTKGYMKIFSLQFDIPAESTELLLLLAECSKWYIKTDSQIQLAIKKLSKFSPKFQIELIENAIANNYQGLVYPNSKSQEQQFLTSNLPVYEQRKNERQELGNLASAILANRNI